MDLPGRPGKLSGFAVSDLMRALVRALPGEQKRLDRTYLERLAAAAAAVSRLPAGWQALAASLAPPRQLIAEVSVAAEVRFTERGSGAFALGVELLSLGYRRRFAHSGLTSNTTTLVLRQVPLAPASGPRLRESPSVPEEVE